MKNMTVKNIYENQKVVSLFEKILMENNITLSHNNHILDFGCGSGHHVYEYLDSGYQNVFGFDTKNYVSLREPPDISHFRFNETGDLISLPFPDNYFDFVYSNQVFEHVIDKKKSFEEIYRVLKPGGVTIHIFPSKWRPIEPHIFVPFGGAINFYLYYLFFATIGIRNSFQKELSPQDTAKANFNYARAGLKYLDGRQIENMLLNIFDYTFFQEDYLIKYSTGRSSYLYPLIQIFPPLLGLYRFAHTKVVFCGKNF